MIEPDQRDPVTPDDLWIDLLLILTMGYNALVYALAVAAKEWAAASSHAGLFLLAWVALSRSPRKR